MAQAEPHTLDVREALRNGEEPLPHIMKTIRELKPDQPLRLLATFEPLPLYTVLAKKGYGHESRRVSEGDWEILFMPGTATAPNPAPRAAFSTAAKDGAWPVPGASLDNRGLGPPEPMMRILDTLEHLDEGDVLQAINDRDPVFLYPELEARGAAIRVEKKDDGVYLLIRRGAQS